MKNQRLTQWLQDHTAMLGQPADPADSSLHLALYEGLIEAVRQGETGLLDSLAANAAAQAAATGRPLPDLLDVPQRLRARLWQRLSDEIDPEPALAMLTTLDVVFTRLNRRLMEAYLTAAQISPPAQADETARLYAESEKKVMAYAAEMAQANRELARLEQTKTDFIGIAAHELKTPLTVIQGYVNMLADMGLEPGLASLIQGIQRGAERMGGILDNMLDLSALGTHQMKLVFSRANLKSLVDLTIAQQQAALSSRGQTVALENLDTLPWLELDSNRIHQALTQLVSNAIKYTPDGGVITISGRLLPPTETAPPQVRLMIKDTGVGIAPEDRDTIFESFRRTGNSKLHSTGQTKFMGAGPGLGLAIVKGLIEAHGGRVWADSPGFDLQNCPGSTFNIVLPVNPGGPPPVSKIKRLKRP